ncbi:acyl-CoA dehydratase activase [Chloroflexota bacterium]
MMVEYWKWPEVDWVSTGIDSKKAAVITVGVDVGAISSKAAIMCDGELYAFSVMRTDGDSKGSAQMAIDKALKGAGMQIGDIHYIVSTGYGRANAPFAGKTMTEIACHARGAHYMYGPTVRTVLDMGGQDCKAIICDAEGKVVNFIMNDKCASGAGRGIEIFADMVAVPIQEMGRLSLDVEKEPEPVSTTCVTYANSMAAYLMARGTPRNEVLASQNFSIAWRVYIMLKRIGVEKDLAITGGIAKNTGITSRIERELGFESLPPKGDPQIVGAVGAALFGAEAVASGGG